MRKLPVFPASDESLDTESIIYRRRAHLRPPLVPTFIIDGPVIASGVVLGRSRVAGDAQCMIEGRIVEARGRGERLPRRDHGVVYYDRGHWG